MAAGNYRKLLPPLVSVIAGQQEAARAEDAGMRFPVAKKRGIGFKFCSTV